MTTKYVIITPYNDGDAEDGNLQGLLAEIKYDNPDYVIRRCFTCEKCGAINDTVEPAPPDSIMLCDYCTRRREQ